MNKTKKVFCIKCVYYFRSVYIPRKEECRAFENLMDTYWAAKSQPKVPPGLHNQYNDCNWFEPKEIAEKKKWWKVW